MGFNQSTNQLGLFLISLMASGAAGCGQPSGVAVTATATMPPPVAEVQDFDVAVARFDVGVVSADREQSLCLRWSQLQNGQQRQLQIDYVLSVWLSDVGSKDHSVLIREPAS